MVLSLYRSLGLLALAACAVVGYAGGVLCDSLTRAYRAVRAGVIRFVVAAASAFASPSSTRPEARLVAARPFLRRILKRERPLFCAQWRMCPSV